MVAQGKLYPTPSEFLAPMASPWSTAAVGVKQPTGSRALICVWPWRKPERDAIILWMALHHTNQRQIGPRDPKYTPRTHIQPSASSLNYYFCLCFDIWISTANKEKMGKLGYKRHPNDVELTFLAVNHNFHLKRLHTPAFFKSGNKLACAQAPVLQDAIPWNKSFTWAGSLAVIYEVLGGVLLESVWSTQDTQP